MSLYNPKAKQKVKPSRHSGGTSGKLSLKGHKTQTPVVPYVPSEPSHIPGVATASAQSAARVLAQQQKRITRARALQLLPKSDEAAGKPPRAAKPQSPRPKFSAPSKEKLPAVKEPKQKALPNIGFSEQAGHKDEGKRILAGEANRRSKMKPLALKKEEHNLINTLSRVKSEGAKADRVRGQKAAKKRGPVGIPQPKLSPTLRHPKATLAAEGKLKRAKAALSKGGTTVTPKEHGTLTPEEWAVIIKQEAHKLGQKMTPQEIAEGIGTIKAENNLSTENTGQIAKFGNASQAHIGPWAEEEAGFGNQKEREGARSSTRLALKNFFENDRSFNQAWGQYQEDQSGLPGGGAKTYGSEFLDAAKTAAAPNPKAVRNYKAALANAKSLGIKPEEVQEAAKAGPPPKQVVTRYKAGLSAAKELAHAHIPYPQPDQHFGLQDSPAALDCSAAVSWVLNKMGVLKTEVTSGEMGNVPGLAPGPGAVTVYYNAGHTFMSFGNRFFGTSVNNSDRGLSFYKNPGSEYLAQYSVAHVKGLGTKQAIQLGLVVPGGGLPSSGPDIQFSNGGSTATVTGGTEQTKAGFSNTPIKLTPAQERRHTLRKLKAVGVGPTEETQATSKAASELSALEKKYGLSS